jgi:F-type H+-transporting ATPase subunit delta
MISVAANRYGQALVDVVLSPGSGLEPNAVQTQLRAVESLLKESSELRHVLNSPAVPASRKRGVIAALAPELGLSGKIRNFFFVLIDHRRIGQVSAIREAFDAAINQRTGFVRADVTSAQPLSETQRNTLTAELHKLTGKSVRAEFSVDPALVGGVVTRIGSTVYDGSVRGQLESLRRRLVAETV